MILITTFSGVISTGFAHCFNNDLVGRLVILSINLPHNPEISEEVSTVCDFGIGENSSFSDLLSGDGSTFFFTIGSSFIGLRIISVFTTGVGGVLYAETCIAGCPLSNIDNLFCKSSRVVFSKRFARSIIPTSSHKRGLLVSFNSFMYSEHLSIKNTI